MDTKLLKQGLILVLTAVAGFGCGLVQHALTPSLQRAPSWAKEAPKPGSTYENLPCPSIEEYRRFATGLHLELPASLDLCSDNVHGPLAKLLLFTDSLNIRIPPDWNPILREDLQDPLAFLARNSTKLTFDFNQAETIAYNRTAKKEIFLGGLFFRQPPLEGFATLMHEARHSSEFDPGHVVCRRGDIPKTSGGCDQELSIDPKNAGAYSYGAAFSAAVGLYAENIMPADREFMLSSSLATISTRFNILPEQIARAFDLVAILDKSGNVFLLHPFLRDPIPLPLPFLNPGEKVERTEFNVRNNGLLLFTSEHRAFTWNSSAGFSRLYGDGIPESVPILDAARIRVPFGDYPYYNFLTASHEIKYYVFNAGAGAYELKPYPTFPAGTAPPDLNRLFMGLSARSLFLGKDGQIYIGQRYANETPFDPRRDLQLHNRVWIQGTGGVVFESLYGVSSDGKVQFTKTDILPNVNEDIEEEEVFTVSDSTFQATGDALARKVLEGLTFRALLDSQGALSFETYDRQVHSRWQKDGLEVVDFTILRKHRPTPALTGEKPDAAFLDHCHLRKAITDPWLGVGMGLDDNGRLVIGLPSGDCAIAGNKAYRDLRLQEAAKKTENRSEERKNPWSEPESVSRNVLKLTTDTGNVETLRPYDYR